MAILLFILVLRTCHCKNNREKDKYKKVVDEHSLSVIEDQKGKKLASIVKNSETS